VDTRVDTNNIGARHSARQSLSLALQTRIQKRVM